MDMPPPKARPSPPLSYQSLEETVKSEPISNYDQNVQELKQLFGSNVSNMENREQKNLAFKAQSNASNSAPNTAAENADVMNELMEEEGNDSEDDCILFEEIYFPQTFPRPLLSNSDALTKREDDTISGNKPFNITVIQPSFFLLYFYFC